MSMTIDEIIGAFQDYANGRRLSITDEVTAAIPILREAKENEGFTDWPVCPKCSELVHMWERGRLLNGRLPSCRECGVAFSELELRYRLRVKP